MTRTGTSINWKQLAELVKKGEDRMVDFKRSRAECLTRGKDINKVRIVPE